MKSNINISLSYSISKISRNRFSKLVLQISAFTFEPCSRKLNTYQKMDYVKLLKSHFNTNLLDSCLNLKTFVVPGNLKSFQFIDVPMSVVVVILPIILMYARCRNFLLSVFVNFNLFHYLIQFQIFFWYRTPSLKIWKGSILLGGHIVVDFENYPYHIYVLQ